MSKLNFDPTIPTSAETKSLKDISNKTGNVYESIVIMSNRAQQVSKSLKEELHSKLNEFAMTTDNLEEIHENREQIEISKFYERMPHAVLMSMNEFMNDELYYRKRGEETAE